MARCSFSTTKKRKAVCFRGILRSSSNGRLPRPCSFSACIPEITRTSRVMTPLCKTAAGGGRCLLHTAANFPFRLQCFSFFSGPNVCPSTFLLHVHNGRKGKPQAASLASYAKMTNDTNPGTATRHTFSAHNSLFAFFAAFLQSYQKQARHP